MGYQVLARKWRPHQFRDVVGQTHVLTALGNALDHNRLHHAYLFSGTRGVGKTTIARIFAKGLNCEQGVTSIPCDVCSSCQEIDQGRFVDLLEIDAASRTKVEDTRDLLDNVQYKPARGRYKIYLIDEVHMLSRHSFNALLKTLEEPPEYVKFILATTDPQKLPVTVLSRCLQFHLKHLDTTQIKNQLAHVLAEESVPAQSRALSLIAKAAEGSMRDALSLTDQAIALGNGAVVDDLVSEMLGTLSSDQGILLLEALSEAHATPVMQCLTVLADVGVEWDGLLKELGAQLHHVAMAQALPESVDPSSPDANRILSLAQALSPQDVQLFYQIVLQGRQDLPFAPDGRAGLEMVLLRMLAFRPVTSDAFSPNVIGAKSAPEAAQRIAQSTDKSPSIGSSSTHDKISALKAQVFSQRSVTTSEPESEPAPCIAQDAVPEDEMPVDALPEDEMHPPLSADMVEYREYQEAQDQQYQELQDYQELAYQEPPEMSVPVSPLVSPPSAASSETATSSDIKSAPVRLASSGGLLAARNMLRSRSRQQEGKAPKKDKSVSPNDTNATVFERVHQKHAASINVTSNVERIPKTQNEPSDEAYRWEPMLAQSPADPLVITPEKMKLAFTHERTDEMREKLEREANERDEWSRISHALVLPQLVKQLALNASMEKAGEQIRLCLRPPQAHLNTEKAKDTLTEALRLHFDASVFVSVDIGIIGISPLEWREKLYTEKLSHASDALRNDPNVRYICQHFCAEMDEDSIRPL